MQQSTQVTLIERALKNIADKATDRGLQTSKAHSFYNSRDQYLKEKDILFKNFPLVAGYSSQVKNPGDYFIFEFCEQSIIVIRDEQGVLQALSNFCAHRGTKLITNSGNAKRFVCPYHAWTYDCRGKIIGFPHREDFPHCSEYSLIAYPVGEHYGLVWVKPSPGPTLDFSAALGPLAEDLDSFGFSSHIQYAPRQFVSPINWKLMVEGSLETYHFKYAHKDTIAPMFFDNLGVFDWKGPHGRMFLPKQEIKSLPTSKKNWNIREVGNLIYFFFPNTIMLVQPDHATLMSSFPISERESLIHGGTLIPSAPVHQKAETHWKKNIEIFWEAILEDFAMAERVQLGLNSGSVADLRFGRSEYLVHRFQQEIDSAIR